MEKEKKNYEEPVVEKVEFDFSDRIAASGCQTGSGTTFGNCFGLIASSNSILNQAHAKGLERISFGPFVVLKMKGLSFYDSKYNSRRCVS